MKDTFKLIALKEIEPTIVLNFFQSFNKVSLNEVIFISASLIHFLVKRNSFWLHLLFVM